MCGLYCGKILFLLEKLDCLKDKESFHSFYLSIVNDEKINSILKYFVPKTLLISDVTEEEIQNYTLPGSFLYDTFRCRDDFKRFLMNSPHKDLIKRIVQKENVYTETPLCVASFEKEDNAMLKLFLEEFNADPNQRGLHGAVAIFSAAVDGIKLLLKHGADTNIRHYLFESTPLHEAAENNQIHLAQLLLLHGADPNIMDWFNYTPLHKAISKNHVDI